MLRASHWDVGTKAINRQSCNLFVLINPFHQPILIRHVFVFIIGKIYIGYFRRNIYKTERMTFQSIESFTCNVVFFFRFCFLNNKHLYIWNIFFLQISATALIYLVIENFIFWIIALSV